MLGREIYTRQEKPEADFTLGIKKRERGANRRRVHLLVLVSEIGTVVRPSPLNLGSSLGEREQRMVIVAFTVLHYRWGGIFSQRRGAQMIRTD